MKAILEFDLNEHYEKMAHVRAVKADSAYNALYKIQEYMRRCHKETEDFSENLDVIKHMTEINGIIEDEGINLDVEWA